MSTVKLPGRASASAIAYVLEAEGATITWPPGTPIAPITTLLLDVEIDARAAFEQLPQHWFEPEDQLFRVPDPRDIGDFVAACIAGDRATALALIPRLVDDVAAQDAAERTLRTARGAVH